MTHIRNIENLTTIFAKLDAAKLMVESEEFNLDSSDYELGYISAFETILTEIKNFKSAIDISNLISSHFDFYMEMEKEQVKNLSAQEYDLAHFAYPLACRIVDETRISIQEDYQKLINVLAMLFRQNQFAINELIGTSIIEEDYFNKL